MNRKEDNMNVFIISLLLICLMGCSAQNVKDVKKALFLLHVRFASILSEGEKPDGSNNGQLPAVQKRRFLCVPTGNINPALNLLVLDTRRTTTFAFEWNNITPYQQ